jgi:YbgC/YbaW family acyl-CoA thioester hydrolase
MRVNWVDTDGSGTIHYTAALRYFEVAEHQLMRKLLGKSMGFAERGFGFPRVHVECDYKAPLRYPDEFECTARVVAVGHKSVTYGYEIRRSDSVLCIVGKIVAVMIDKNGEPISLPKEFREVLERVVAGGT